MNHRTCKVNKYCGFEVIGDYPDCQVEVCRYCGEKVTYNKVDGRVDSRQYLFDHIRDFCQPYGETRRVYEEVYGVEHARNNQKRIEAGKGQSLDESLSQGKFEAEEALRIWKRLEGKGFSTQEIIRELKKS